MDKTELKKINTIAHKFGHQLLDTGIKWIRIAFKLEPKVYEADVIRTFLADQLGLPASTLSLSDQKYYVETWGKWGQIIDFDLIDQQQYMSDYMDCDNFAFAYASRAGMIYGINSCAVAYGSVHNPITKQLLGYHAFNLIVIHENGVLKLKLYEPMTDDSIEWRKGQDNSLQNPGWVYRVNWIIMY